MSAPAEAAPSPLTFCAGRLVGEPVEIPVRLYNGEGERLFLGVRWRLDGKPVSPLDAHAFRLGFRPLPA
jgi:hypothetical protein